jgi:hypothetical protein
MLPGSIAGKSFDRKIPRVCKRVGKHKVAIFGHSWGSALGVANLSAADVGRDLLWEGERKARVLDILRMGRWSPCYDNEKRSS